MIKRTLMLLILSSVATTLTADQNEILDSQKSEDVKRQASGDYPELNRQSIVPLAAIQNA